MECEPRNPALPASLIVIQATRLFRFQNKMHTPCVPSRLGRHPKVATLDKRGRGIVSSAVGTGRVDARNTSSSGG